MAPVETARVLHTNPRCLLTELGDGTGVVLDLDTKFYFTLNRTGVIVWRELAAPDGRSADAIADKLATEFAIDRESARADVTALVETMLADGLVKA